MKKVKRYIFFGIACEENYHDKLVDERLDKNKFPCLCYTREFHGFLYGMRLKKGAEYSRIGIFEK